MHSSPTARDGIDDIYPIPRPVPKGQPALDGLPRCARRRHDAWVTDPRLDGADWATACQVADNLNETADDQARFAVGHSTVGNANASTPAIPIMHGLAAAAKAEAIAEGDTLDKVITRALWAVMTEVARYRIPMRNVLKEESVPYSHIRVITVYEDGEFICHVIYIMGGKSRGTAYTTDRGLLAAINRNADIDLPRGPHTCIEDGVRTRSWSIAGVHTRLQARVEAGEVPWGYIPGE
jgi:hypothetical protein